MVTEDNLTVPDVVSHAKWLLKIPLEVLSKEALPKSHFPPVSLSCRIHQIAVVFQAFCSERESGFHCLVRR